MADTVAHQAGGGNSWPRKLDQEGCLYGQAVEKEVHRLRGEDIKDLKERFEKVESKIEAELTRVRWALITAAVTFATMVLSLWLK